MTFYYKCSFLYISDWLINRLNKNIVCLTWRASLPIRMWERRNGQCAKGFPCYLYEYIVREMRKLCRHFNATCQHYLLELEGMRKVFLSLFTCIVAGENEHKEGIERERGGGININCNYMQHLSFGQHETFIYIFLSPRWYPDTLNIWFK